MTDKKDIVIGESRKGTNGYYKVVRYVGVDMHFRKVYECKFSSGFTLLQIESEILNNNVTDLLALSFYKCLLNSGNSDDKFQTSEFRKLLYKDMVDKCNKPKYEMYKYYGALGFTICKRWQSKFNFYIDFPRIEGYRDMMVSPCILDYRVTIKKLPNGEYCSDDKEFNLKNCKLEMVPSEHVFISKMVTKNELMPMNESYLKDIKENDYLELLKKEG